jgi:hypothetical protein
MFCPQCKAEYRPGFNYCSDCDVDLVERLPELDRSGAGPKVWQSHSRIAYSTDDQRACVFVCEGLRAAGIPFEVFQQNHQFLKGVEQQFRIRVPHDCYSRAEEVIRHGQVDFTDEPEDQQIMELATSDGIPIPRAADKGWDPEHWNSEDATVEIWCGSDQERTRMIELSLGENRIHIRTEVLPDGSRRILVLPRDESRGREIVREISEGSPPPV